MAANRCNNALRISTYSDMLYVNIFLNRNFIFFELKSPQRRIIISPIVLYETTTNNVLERSVKRNTQRENKKPPTYYQTPEVREAILCCWGNNTLQHTKPYCVCQIPFMPFSSLLKELRIECTRDQSKTTISYGIVTTREVINKSRSTCFFENLFELR